MSITKSDQLAAIVTKVMYQFAHNIQTFKVGLNVNYRFVSFKTGNNWLPFYFSPGTAIFSETKKESTHGPTFDQLLEFLLPGELSAQNEALKMLDQFPVIVKITYNTGAERIIGTPDVPALFSNDYVSNKAKTSSTTGFKCLSTERAYIYQAEDNSPYIPPET
jgi:hypothetical protein